MATTKRRKTTTVSGVTYEFVTLRPYKVFGRQPVWTESESVPVADLEKSLVDGLDHPEYCGGIAEVAKALHAAWDEQDVDPERLTDYARQMRNRAIFKRLGYLVELLSLPAAAFVETWQKALSKGYAQLGPKLEPEEEIKVTSYRVEHGAWRSVAGRRDVSYG